MNSPKAEVRIRRMSEADLYRVMEIGKGLQEVPHWPASAYGAAIDLQHIPRRIALVAELEAEEHTSGAKAPIDVAGLDVRAEARALHLPRSPSADLADEKMEFADDPLPQGLKPRSLSGEIAARLKSRPDTKPDGRSGPEPSRTRGGVGISTAAGVAAFQEGGFGATSGRIVGFAVAGLVAPEAELETIAVSAKAQRQGVGALLLRALAEELRTERVTGLILEVRASNRAALGFYRAQGFIETGRRPRYYADPEEDAVLMGLNLG